MERCLIMSSNEINLGSPIREEKIVIRGESETRNVYRVDISNIYYNDENGRISTFMAEYNSSNKNPISNLSREEYNNQIMEYMINAESSGSYNKTKSNIKSIGQMEPGIILSDGRVIDGNRRFTFLRDLYKETHLEKFKYFECFVIPAPKNKEDRMVIKSLELMAQYGTDSRVPYSPVDRLADIYKDLIGEDKLFTPDEYVTRSGNIYKSREIMNLMINAQTMWEYLDFINYRGRWDIARDLKLDGPIKEISNLRRSINGDEWEENHHMFFIQLKNITTGDRTREIRKLVKLYKTNKDKFEFLADEAFNLALEEEQLKRENLKQNLKEATIELKKKKHLFKKSIDAEIVKINLKEARQRQLKALERILTNVAKIDGEEIKRSNVEFKKEIGYILEEITRRINILKDNAKHI